MCIVVVSTAAVFKIEVYLFHQTYGEQHGWNAFCVAECIPAGILLVLAVAKHLPQHCFIGLKDEITT